MTAPSKMPHSLDYFDLLKESKLLNDFVGNKVIRLAILADFASQHLVPLLKTHCARHNIKLELYEASYDSIDVEILNTESQLYKFEPNYIAILLSTEKLKARLYAAIDRKGFATDAIDRLSNLWITIKNNSHATIIQSNFVMPSERAFGNYEHKVEHSIGSIIAAINSKIAEASLTAKNVLLCDIDFLAAEIGRERWFDERLWSMAKIFCRLENLPRLTKNIADIMLSANGHFVKCVILDLDNTLWGGVIGDDGLQGILLGDYDEGESFVAFQNFLLELKRRGIILCVVSKNEHVNAVLPFREHPNMKIKESDITVFIANWDNKADNIRRIQQTLNIGFDTMVFLDDNPFERNIVREFLPEVIVPEMPEDPAYYLRTLADLNLFETASYSDADLQRADQYKGEAQRELVKATFTNIEEYLISLDMKIKLERFTPLHLPRISQLIKRSNQFNLTTRRYSESVCDELMNKPHCVPFTLTLSDKFGDYGLISVIILNLDKDEMNIDEYLMSCRVLQRGVEHFAMNNIVRFAAQKGIKRIVGNYIKTAKNDMVKNFFSGFGFKKIAEDNKGNSTWEISTDDYKPSKTFITPLTIEI